MVRGFSKFDNLSLFIFLINPRLRLGFELKAGNSWYVLNLGLHFQKKSLTKTKVFLNLVSEKFCDSVFMKDKILGKQCTLTLLIFVIGNRI